MMIRSNIPNQHKVTVESGPASKGEGYVVIAILWSLDETAQDNRRWVRYDSLEEADRVAESLADADWNQILAWHKKA